MQAVSARAPWRTSAAWGGLRPGWRVRRPGPGAAADGGRHGTVYGQARRRRAARPRAWAKVACRGAVAALSVAYRAAFPLSPSRSHEIRRHPRLSRRAVAGRQRTAGRVRRGQPLPAAGPAVPDGADRPDARRGALFQRHAADAAAPLRRRRGRARPAAGRRRPGPAGGAGIGRGAGLAARGLRAGRALWVDLQRRLPAGARRPARGRHGHHPLERCAGAGGALSGPAGRDRPPVRAGWPLAHVGGGDGRHRPGPVPGGAGPRAGGGAERGQAAGGVHAARRRAVAVQPVPDALRRGDLGGGAGAAVRAGAPGRRPGRGRAGGGGQHEPPQFLAGVPAGCRRHAGGFRRERAGGRGPRAAGARVGAAQDRGV